VNFEIYNKERPDIEKNDFKNIGRVFRRFSEPTESDYVDWVEESHSKIRALIGKIAIVPYLIWAYVLTPLLFPNEANQSGLQAIYFGLLVFYTMWAFNISERAQRKYKELIFMIGVTSVTLLYTMMITAIQPLHTYAVVFCSITYLFSFTIMTIRIKYQFVYAVIAGLFMEAAYVEIGIVHEIAYISPVFIMVLGIIGLGSSVAKDIEARKSYVLKCKFEIEKKKSESLLSNILPQKIVESFNNGDRKTAESHDSVSILFADIVGFTKISSEKPVDEVVEILDNIFSRFDDLCLKMNVEKIKTIGDAYMAAAGLIIDDDSHCRNIVNLGLEMQSALEELKVLHNIDVSMRIGIATGHVVAGIIGKTKFCYDVWGQTVNTASRLESQSEPGKMLVCGETLARLDSKYLRVEERIEVLKGVGAVKCGYIIDRRLLNRKIEEEQDQNPLAS
jgi:class 3 adenylate cyclase